MTLDPIEIYLPCNVLAVKVTVGPAQRLSILEELALKAVHAGVDRFEQLERLFGLGPRPTIDLVYDLWRQGHLILDFVSGTLELTPRARAAADTGDSSQLAGGECTEAEREVMLDLVTGQVIEVGRLRASIRRWSRRPRGSIRRWAIGCLCRRVVGRPHSHDRPRE